MDITPDNKKALTRGPDCFFETIKQLTIAAGSAWPINKEKVDNPRLNALGGLFCDNTRGIDDNEFQIIGKSEGISGVVSKFHVPSPI